MSNIIPPMVSSSPPPLDDNLDDDEDDEFGDFASANLSYDIGDVIQPSNPSARKVSWGSEATSSDLRLKEGEVEMVKQNGTCGRDSDPGTTDEDEEEVECQVFAKTDVEKGDSIQVPELQQDNTSQDSVVSGATDSGLCSASQNSEGTSPLPHGDDVDRLSPIGLEVPCDMSREESSESDKTLVKSVEENRRTFNGECILAARGIPVSICDSNETQDKMRNVEENCVAEIEDLHSKSSDFDVSESEQFNRLSSTDARDQNQQESSETRMVDGENDGFGDFSEFQTVSEVNVLPSESNVLNDVSDRLFEDRADGEGFSDFHSGAFSKHLDNSESTDSDDFGGFEGVPTMEAAVRGEGATTQCKVMLDSECVDDDDDDFNDEFADFTSAAAPIESGSLFPESQLPESATECSSWADVQTTASLDQIDDDFDDFETADFNTETSSCETDHNKLLSRLQSVVSTLFPSPAEAGSEEASSSNVSLRALGECLDSSSPVWGKLRDVETSHALSYQWSGSAANKILLTALGIDSRNILFGPRWNASVPRFAANLGFSPLEPVRTSQSSPPVLAPMREPPLETPAPSGNEEAVPAAQFDWTSSGLVNPLDCLEASSGAVPRQADQLVQQILAVGQSAPTTTSQLSSEAIQILDSLPDLSFLRAKMLMFPVRNLTPEHSFGTTGQE